MDGRSANLSTVLTKLETQASALRNIVASEVGARPLWTSWNAQLQSGGRQAEERYGEFFAEAILARPVGRDFIWFGVIDWAYRTQRPQHLATNLADLGNRVFYVSIVFESSDGSSRFRLIDRPYPNVFEVRLRLEGPAPPNIYGGFTEDQAADIRGSLDEFWTLLALRAPVVVVQYPSWLPVATSIPGATLVHDCLDLVKGFTNVPRDIADLEEVLIRQADLVVTASQPLANHVSKERSSIVIRNAADVEFFASGAGRAPTTSARQPTVGYFGALDDWFNSSWIELCARHKPDWTFVLIGRESGADTTELRRLPNVQLLGEQPYADLPFHLESFDVAVIPFKMNELTECVNPVKLYEYMAQGKAVVSCPMPEVVNATDLVYIAHTASEFETQIERAIRDDGPDLRARRKAWAAEHNWSQRAESFQAAVSGVTPLVSVVVLAYNNAHLTEQCLHSLITFSDYPNLEIIVVDNASSDKTMSVLKKFAAQATRLRVIANESNLGFAAGNNVGLRAANGEYVVMLNNDTYVTRGWVRDLIRPLMLDTSIGLVGPLTNNIGDEAKVAASYDTMSGMARFARSLQREFARRRYETRNVAFFCVATRRDVLATVGLLDESYGVGFFEDDDYCERVRQAGYRIVIADDVFIHHELSAAFSTMDTSERDEIFRANKAKFEARWGPWPPHRYRDQPGFGA
jgi:GT2 family glycosyltransferase/glycosyltransferase involved in cell wall biosynthesis